ncbi:MAG: DUF3887 domain-containing protein [Roseburia sp.]|nr:DUF3887 domain-containing protein [Roseburia sp.]
MNAEKYVDSVVKKVRCGREKRKEIRQQLLSDISAELEEGETLEHVIGRMGSAAEAAEEFNQNLPEAELKRYRRGKRWKISGCIAVALVLIACGIYWFLPKTYELSKGGYFDAKTVEAGMQEVIAELDRGDYEAMQANATEEMQPVLTAEYMESAKATVSDDWGAFQAYGTAYMVQIKQQGKRFAVGQMTVSYENASVTYTLTFDEDMKLAGLFIK